MITTLKKPFCLLAALFAILVFTAPAFAINPTVFGPKNFKIKWWCFHLSLNRFKMEKSGDGVITITKNTSEKRIWRGFIRINMNIIPLRHFLSSDALVLEKQVKLRSRNHMLVCLLGTRGASIRVEVTKKEATPPPEVNISASPLSIEVGESSVLTWTSTHADTCSIEPNIGSVNVNGSTTVSPIETTAYFITANGPGGSATNSVTVTVFTPPEDVDYGVPEDEQQGGAGIVGETICILNGSSFEFRSDLTFPSPHRLGLSFEAFYNSRSQTSGSLGYGWTHTYDVSLDLAFQIEGNDFVKIVDQTGRAHYFAEENPGSYRGVFKECTRVKLEAGESVWHRLDGTRYGFSTIGQLVWIEDEKGNRLELIYDAQGRLDTVTDIAGIRALTFYYSGDGLLQRIEGAITAAVPDGIWVTYDYDDHQNLTSVTYADGSGFKYSYTDPNDIHNMTEKRNNSNHILNTWSYNEQDRAVSKFSVDGKGVNNISYVSDTQVDVTDAYGTERTYKLEEINGSKRVSAVQGTGSAPYSSGNVARWSYDDNKRVIETESAGGTIHQYQDYDKRGNPGTVKLAVGTPEERVITYTYHPDMNVPLSRSEASVLGSENKISIWDYDDDYNSSPNEDPTRHLSRIIEKGFTKDSSGVEAHYEYVTTFTYNSKGQVHSIDGPVPGMDDTTTFSYDPTAGDLLSITQPLIGTTIFSGYDPAGRVGTITDVNGQSRHFKYDAGGRVTAVINDADGSSTNISYNLAGLPDSVTDEDSVTRSFEYDNIYGRLSRISDVEGNYIAYAYDEQGNRIEMSKHDQLGARTSRRRWSYQHPIVPGKLWKEINADDTDTVYEYDSEGNIAFVKDPNENTTYYAYDPLNRLKMVTQPGNVVTSYEYDTHGNLTSVTDAEDHMTTYAYDDMGRVVSTTSPDTGIASYVYDPVGNPLRKTDAKGIKVQYTYDTLNRLTGVHFPDPTQDITYTYDAGTYGKGRRTGMSDPSGNTTFSYDGRGRLVQKTSTIFDHSYTISYSHTPGNRISSVTYPGQRRITYIHDDTGKIEGVYTTCEETTTDLIKNIGYLPFGPATSLIIGNGSTAKSVFDERYRMTIANPNAETERIYGYDANGNITSIDVTSQPWKNQNFSYDTLNRLVEAAGIYGTISYAYDKVGNRLARSINDRTETYTYASDSNRLLSIDGPDPLSLTYDGNGNVIGAGDKTFIYNQNNRLIRMDRSDRIETVYTYNGFGQRVIREEDGVTTLFHYDLNGNLIGESQPDGTFNSEYLYMEKSRLAKVNSTDDKFYYYLNNHIGVPEILIDEEGRAVWEAAYRPFGEAFVNPNSKIVNNFRLPGQVLDVESGLHYNYFRHYHPGIGRYMEADPIGMEGGINLYVYALNNPVNLSDPTGEMGIPGIVIGAVSGAFAGFAAGMQSGHVWAGVIGGAAGGIIGGSIGFMFPQAGTVVGGMIGGAISGSIGGAVGGGVGKRLRHPEASNREMGLAIAKGAGIGAVAGGTAGGLGAAALGAGATPLAADLAGAMAAAPIATGLGLIDFDIAPETEGHFQPNFWPPEITEPMDFKIKPEIYGSRETIVPGGSITLWVDSGGLACPPYHWSTTGKGYSISATTTQNDLETVTLTSDGGRCGVNFNPYVKVNVQDGCGAIAEKSVRNSEGKWGNLNEQGSGNCDPLGICDAGSACNQPIPEIIDGIQKWTFSQVYGGHCTKDGDCWWRCAGDCRYLPPCGGPHECNPASSTCGGGVECYCWTVAYRHYPWVCGP